MTGPQTHRGDVLIIQIDEDVVPTYHVGKVSRDGQQDFENLRSDAFLPIRGFASAQLAAGTMLEEGGRIFVQRLGEGWSVITK